MKIQDRTSLSPSATQAGRTPDTQKSNPDTAGKRPGAGTADGDRVEFSATLGRLSQAIAAQGTQRAGRVQALSTDYQAGRFHPNAQATGRAMVADALSEQALPGQG